MQGTAPHLGGRLCSPSCPSCPLPPPNLSCLWTEGFLVGCGDSYSTLLFASASFPSLEHCKPISRKKVPLTPGWMHWLKQRDTLFLALSRTSSL